MYGLHVARLDGLEMRFQVSERAEKIIPNICDVANFTVLQVSCMIANIPRYIQDVSDLNIINHTTIINSKLKSSAANTQPRSIIIRSCDNHIPCKLSLSGSSEPKH